jgi:hypothetical protein
MNSKAPLALLLLACAADTTEPQSDEADLAALRSATFACTTILDGTVQTVGFALKGMQSTDSLVWGFSSATQKRDDRPFKVAPEVSQLHILNDEYTATVSATALNVRGTFGDDTAKLILTRESGFTSGTVRVSPGETAPVACKLSKFSAPYTSADEGRTSSKQVCGGKRGLRCPSGEHCVFAASGPDQLGKCRR